MYYLITKKDYKHFNQTENDKKLLYLYKIFGINNDVNDDNHRTITKPYCRNQNNKNIGKLVNILQTFNNKYADLVSMTPDHLYKEYYHYNIPKRNGGKRHIDEPKYRLREAHNELKSILETDFNALYHNTAFAYIKNKNTKMCAKANIKAEVRCALDFHDFFGSITLDWTMKMLLMQYPFCDLNIKGITELRKSLSICFLKGGLPQGTTISPMLTNLIMIPFDYYMSYGIYKDTCGKVFYTRYADDISISFKNTDMKNSEAYKYSIYKVTSTIKHLEAPIKLNPDKTKILRKGGKNWCLGLMLNNENNITIGHMKKRYMKAMIWKYVHDHRCLNETEKGILAYYRSIEPEYVDMIIKRAENKRFKQFIGDRS